MIEEKLTEQLLLNAGASLPFLLIVWMFVWKMWPGIQELFEKNLDNKAASAQLAASSESVPVQVKVTLVMDENVAAVAKSFAGAVGRSAGSEGEVVVPVRRAEFVSGDGTGSLV